MNETLKAISERFSCRSYTGRMPSDDDLRAIAQAAIEAPSGMNMQPWHIIVVKDQKIIDDLDDEGLCMLQALDNKALYERIMDRGGKLFYNAPCMVVIALAQSENPSGFEKVDLGIAAQNVVLAATSLGINSVHCGFAAFPFSGPRADEFKQRLQFPEGYEMGIAVLLGYAEETKEPHEPDQSKITWIG